MPGQFPGTVRPWWRYLPLFSLAALAWWMVGMGLWVHYTQVMYNRSLDTLELLNIVVAGSIADQIERVMGAVKATCVLYALSSVMGHALSIWWGWVESRQDLEGKVHDTHGIILLYCNVAIQVYQWILLIWMGVLLKGMGVFEGTVGSNQNSLENAYLAIQYWTAQGGGTLAPSGIMCPIQCLNVLSIGDVFNLNPGQVVDATQQCICDAQLIKQGWQLMEDATDAVPGSIVGLLLLYIYGLVQVAGLVAMFNQIKVQQDVSDRLTDAEAGGAYKPRVGVGLGGTKGVEGGTKGPSGKGSGTLGKSPSSGGGFGFGKVATANGGGVGGGVGSRRPGGPVSAGGYTRTAAAAKDDDDSEDGSGSESGSEGGRKGVAAAGARQAGGMAAAAGRGRGGGAGAAGRGGGGRGSAAAAANTSSGGRGGGAGGRGSTGAGGTSRNARSAPPPQDSDDTSGRSEEDSEGDAPPVVRRPPASRIGR